MDSELYKALDVLLHDLRTPLGVAHGSLRLVKNERQVSHAERERALACTVEALGRISRLCDDASLFVRSFDGESQPLATVPVPVSLLAERVALAARPIMPVARGEIGMGAARLFSVDRWVQAAVAILASIAGARPPDGCEVEIEAPAGELRVLLGSGSDRSALRGAARVHFNPWKGGHGLSLPSACRVIERSGGSVWELDVERRAVAVILPLEVSVS